LALEAAHVAVVVLCWNGYSDTLACLESLSRVDWQRLTTIVVDNGSTDGTAEAVLERFPEVLLLRSDENLGFAEGNNVGLRAAFAADAEHVLLLNNDTVVDAGLVRALVEEAQRRPDAGALCPMIYYTQPAERIWYAGAAFDPRRVHNGTHTGYGDSDRGQYAKTREIGRATGAAMLVPRRVVEEVGYLDTRLFLQVEDVEWSLRMRAAGYRILFVPAGKVWHRVSVATGGEHAPATAYYEMRNSLAVCARHAPLRGLAGLRREAAMVAVHVLHTRKADRPAKNLSAVLQGWRDYHAGRLGPWREGLSEGSAPYDVPIGVRAPASDASRAAAAWSPSRTL
jgi:GT2 family glycosyltransferase